MGVEHAADHLVRAAEHPSSHHADVTAAGKDIGTVTDHINAAPPGVVHRRPDRAHPEVVLQRRLFRRDVCIRLPSCILGILGRCAHMIQNMGHMAYFRLGRAEHQIIGQRSVKRVAKAQRQKQLPSND